VAKKYDFVRNKIQVSTYSKFEQKDVKNSLHVDGFICTFRAFLDSKYAIRIPCGCLWMVCCQTFVNLEDIFFYLHL